MTTSESALGAAKAEDSCPLCDGTVSDRKAKTLYGHRICAKCYNAFASRRQFAYVIDAVALYVLSTGFFGRLDVSFTPRGAPQDEVELGALTWSLLMPALFLFKDSFSGYSLGKRVCRVRVVDATTGVPTGVRASVLRTLPLVIPIVPLIVAFQLKRGRRWGDGWARTRVIWTDYADRPVFRFPAPDADARSWASSDPTVS